jgi:hypothetical protein
MMKRTRAEKAMVMANSAGESEREEEESDEEESRASTALCWSKEDEGIEKASRIAYIGEAEGRKPR